MENRFLGFLGIIKKSGKLIEGYNKCEEAVKQNRVSLVILTNALSENSKEKFLNYCKRYNVKYIEDVPVEDINMTLGSRNLKVICIKDEVMSNRLLDFWNIMNS